MAKIRLAGEFLGEFLENLDADPRAVRRPTYQAPSEESWSVALCHSADECELCPIYSECVDLPPG